MSTIRLMERKDAGEVLDMMRVFYASPAVLSNGSDDIFEADIRGCIDDENPYAEGYVFEEDGILEGYVMLAKSFSMEYGRPCIWIEDLYIKEGFRGKGLGSSFFAFLEEKYEKVLFRLEVELENEVAVEVYKKAGFTNLPYYEMIKLSDKE